MLETMRNIGKVVVGCMVGLQGVGILAVTVWALGAVMYLFQTGDVDNFLTHLFLASVCGGLIFCFVWMGHDAATELKNIQIQKDELKALDPKDAPLPDVPTKEPWLYP